MRSTKRGINKTIRSNMLPTNNHWEVFIFLLRHKPPRIKNHLGIQIKVEKKRNLLDRGTRNWNVRDHSCCDPFRKLHIIWPLHGLGQRKWRRMDQVWWWYSLSTARWEGSSTERRPTKFGNRLHAFIQKDFHKADSIMIIWMYFVQ